MGRNRPLAVTINVLVLAACCYGGWALTGWLSGVCWVAAFFALGSTFMAAESKPCPACGEPAHAPKGKVERCLKCNEYVAHGKNGYVHVHGAVLPEEFRWPEGCAACGAPATRTVPVSGEKSAALANVGKSAVSFAVGFNRIHTGGETTFSLDVPHCDAHDDGAYFLLGTLAPPALMFRSEVFRDAFCALNETEKQRGFGVPEATATARG